VNDALTWILDIIQNVDPTLRALLAGAGMLLETSILVGLIVPGDTIVIVASTGVENWVEYFALLFAVIVGSLAGESIGFALGRFFGPKIRSSRLGVRIGYENWMRAENYLDRRGGIAVFISRFLPVFHSLIPVTVGMSTMRYRKFLSWTVPACVIWAAGYASVGWAAAGTYRELSESLHWAGFIFVGIIGTFLIVAITVRLVLLRHQRRHMEIPGDGDATTREDLP
jgi:membrane protein DedA with SNARE-associated domain